MKTFITGDKQNVNTYDVEFILGNAKKLLYFLSFLDTQMAQAVEFFPRERQGSLYSSLLILATGQVITVYFGVNIIFNIRTISPKNVYFRHYVCVWMVCYGVMDIKPLPTLKKSERTPLLTTFIPTDAWWRHRSRSTLTSFKTAAIA